MSKAHFMCGQGQQGGCISGIFVSHTVLQYAWLLQTQLYSMVSLKVSLIADFWAGCLAFWPKLIAYGLYNLCNSVWQGISRVGKHLPAAPLSVISFCYNAIVMRNIHGFYSTPQKWSLLARRGKCFIFRAFFSLSCGKHWHLYMCIQAHTYT